MDPTIAGLLGQYSLAAYARHAVWQGELESAARIAGNAHTALMQGISYGGFRSITSGDDPEQGMAYNFASHVPGSNLGPLPNGTVVKQA